MLRIKRVEIKDEIKKHFSSFERAIIFRIKLSESKAGIQQTKVTDTLQSLYTE